MSYARDVQARDYGPVQTLVAGHLRLALGVLDVLELSAGAPVMLMRGDDPELSSEGVGDGHAALKLRLLGDNVEHGLSLGATVSAALGVGSDGLFLRDVRSPFRAELLASLGHHPVSWAANIGMSFGRNAKLDEERYGDELTASLGVELFLVPEILSGVIEGEARNPVDGDDERSFEARAGLRTVLDQESVLALSAGAGFDEGVGTPLYRVLLGWVYEPRSRDPDGDGLLDAFDECPLAPEDRDGFRDHDGCPDPDNDNDGVDDAHDECPELAEDFNGYRDDDGCPDSTDDADRDGIHDLADQCPADAEDRDGFEDEDGCPDTDDDGDGVPDKYDRCPNMAEDLDGYVDEDGCPDPDNDGDGFMDDEDHCPLDPEDYDGVQDDDGCPDPLPPGGAKLYVERPGPAPSRPVAVLAGDRIEVLEPIRFKTDSAVIESGYVIVVDEVARIILGDPKITKVHIEGHTDKAGSRASNIDLSRRRAMSVKARLVELGVDEAKLTAEGFGFDRPIADNMTVEGRTKNRRVEFKLER